MLVDPNKNVYLNNIEATVIDKNLAEALATVKYLNDEINKATAYIKTVAQQLHFKTCPNRDILVLNGKCCGVNNWASKTQKVSELLVYLYDQTAKAPHGKECKTLINDNVYGCNCWKSKTIRTAEEFMNEVCK